MAYSWGEIKNGKLGLFDDPREVPFNFHDNSKIQFSSNQSKVKNPVLIPFFKDLRKEAKLTDKEKSFFEKNYKGIENKETTISSSGLNANMKLRFPIQDKIKN